MSGLSARPFRRHVGVSIAAILSCLAVSVSLASSADATPPDIPSTSTAQAELDALTVADEGSLDGYSREEFPHWITISGSCDTRETVLERDGSDVEAGSDCYPDSGSWYSPYDGDTWYAASDIDIDHIVPLAEAWRSGADSWTISTREDFANDLSGPQLIAVTDNVNQSKGDEDPSTWIPPETSYHCTYAKMWIHTKYRWELTLQSSEEAALQDMLNSC